jgi:hypothetical protein
MGQLTSRHAQLGPGRGFLPPVANRPAPQGSRAVPRTVAYAETSPPETGVHSFGILPIGNAVQAVRSFGRRRALSADFEALQHIAAAFLPISWNPYGPELAVSAVPLWTLRGGRPAAPGRGAGRRGPRGTEILPTGLENAVQRPCRDRRPTAN